MLCKFSSSGERDGGLTGHESRMAASRQLSGLHNGFAKSLGGFKLEINCIDTWQCAWPATTTLGQRILHSGRPITLEVCLLCIVAVVVVVVVASVGSSRSRRCYCMCRQ